MQGKCISVSIIDCCGSPWVPTDSGHMTHYLSHYMIQLLTDHYIPGIHYLSVIYVLSKLVVLFRFCAKSEPVSRNLSSLCLCHPLVTGTCTCLLTLLCPRADSSPVLKTSACTQNSSFSSMVISTWRPFLHSCTC